MARIRSSLPTAPPDSGRELVGEVLKALRDEPQADGPVIFEVPQGDTGYVQVIVVWGRWADLPADIRNRIVMEAYDLFGQEHPDDVTADRISMVLPVTHDQAIEMGVLPYTVQSSIHRAHPAYDKILPLLKREGAIEADGATELRLPTLPMAREARDRLQAAIRDIVPEVHWQISEQVGRIFDY